MTSCEKFEVLLTELFYSRWLRLLFGREFPIHDLLFVWDAIFAFRPPLSLVDYVFVAMLEYIRHLSKFGQFSPKSIGKYKSLLFTGNISLARLSIIVKF